jgi:hypothetical protein
MSEAVGEAPVVVESPSPVVDKAIDVVKSAEDSLPPVQKGLMSKIVKKPEIGIGKKAARFIVGASLVAELLTGAGCAVDAVSPEVPIVPPRGPSLSQIDVTSTTERPLIEKEHSFESFKYFEKGGIPTKYILPSGEVVYFDQEKMNAAREEAVRTQKYTEAEIVVYDSVKDENIPGINSSPEHPVLTELPKDVLSDEELAKYNIKIIQAAPDKGEEAMKIYVRKSAVEEKDGIFGNLKNGLTIVALNAPYICREMFEALNSDHRYDDVINLYPFIEPIKDYIPEVIEDIDRNRDIWEQQFPADVKDLDTYIAQSDIEQYEMDYLGFKTRKKVMEEELTPKQRILINVGEAMQKEGNDFWIFPNRVDSIIYGGLYHKAGVQYMNRDITDTDMITITTTVPQQTLAIGSFYFSPSGELIANRYMLPIFSVGEKGKFLTDMNDPNINPDELKKRENDEKYTFWGGFGWKVEHEATHGWMANNPLWAPFHSDEKLVDELTAKRLRKSYTNWIVNGDNSGYPFVLSRPNELDEGPDPNVLDGGFQVSEESQAVNT